MKLYHEVHIGAQRKKLKNWLPKPCLLQLLLSSSRAQDVQRIRSDERVHVTGAYSTPTEERKVAQFRTSHAGIILINRETTISQAF